MSGNVCIEGWERLKIIDLRNQLDRYSFTGGPFGSDLKVSDYVEKGVPVIQLQSIGDGMYYDRDKIYVSEKKSNELSSCCIYPGEIIIAKMAEPLARACIVPDKYNKYVMASDGIRLSVDYKKYNPKYVMYSINEYNFRKNAIRKGTGSTRLRIGLTEFGKMEINVPKLKEQNGIVSILEMQDEIINNYQKLINEMIKYRKNFIRNYILNQIEQHDSKGHQFQRLGYYLTRKTEKVHEKNIEPVSVGVNGIRLRSEVFSKELSKDYSKNKIIVENDLCFGMGTNNIVFDVLLKNETYSVSPAYHVFGIENCDAHFLKLYLNVLNKKQSKKFMIVSARQGKSIDLSGLLNEKLYFPRIEKQEKFVRYIVGFDRNIETLKELLKLYQEQKRGLMQQLLTGKIRVQV